MLSSYVSGNLANVYTAYIVLLTSVRLLLLSTGLHSGKNNHNVRNRDTGFQLFTGHKSSHLA